MPESPEIHCLRVGRYLLEFMGKIDIPDWKGIEKYLKYGKELRIQIQASSGTATARMKVGDVIIWSATTASGDPMDIFRIKPKKGWKFPLAVESLEINAGIVKVKFKPREE